MVVEAVSSVISDEGFQIPSPLAKDALDTAVLVHSYITNPEHKHVLNKHSHLLYGMFKGCLSAKYKQTSYQRERMWAKYNQLRISDDYKAFWETFVSQSVGRFAHPIFYQFVGQAAFNSLVKEYYKHAIPESSVTVSVLTYEEKNTLRYTGSSVCHNLRTKISKSKHPLKKSLLIALNDLAEDEPTKEKSGDWVAMEDRGGLFRLCDEAYRWFEAIELMVREVLVIEKLQCINEEVKSSLIHKIISDEEVGHYWQSLMVEVGREESDLLFKMIAEAYISIRGYSSAKLFMEQYKQANKESLQKQKSLRKTVQTRSQIDKDD